MQKTDMPPYEAKLHIDKKGDGDTWRVMLNDLDVSMLLAQDGLQLEWVDGDAESELIVTMKFGPGALDLTLDADLVQQVLAAKADQ